MYKLLALDLDGTLLNSKNTLSKENIEAVKLASQNGVNVVVCSGRILSSITAISKQLGLSDYALACNGAALHDLKTGKTLYSKLLTHGQCKKVMEIFEDYKDLYIQIYLDDFVYANRLEYIAKNYADQNKNLTKDEKVNVVITENLQSIIEEKGDSVSKFVIASGNVERLNQLREKLSSEIMDVDFTSSGENDFEIMSKGVSKGIALKALAEKLSIKKEETAAIGDNINDYSMIAYAGCGIAMGNANEEVKKIADYITLSNDEHGVANAIIKYILKF